ncbi:MAG: methyltransferase domain-containing protein [Propionibacteriales bacterium]|nr:methyltransferase domain-containing protein [Propionibacteriales bacterium]
MPDPVFTDPRLAPLYDPLDPDRSDLDAYARIVEEFRASSVLDVGCGTGTFGCLLAQQGVRVVGVDPDGASVAVARAKPYADRVQWVVGDATALPPLQVDLATMTANVAQVFVTDEDWIATLQGIHAAVQPGGHLIFEIRDPDRHAWVGWTKNLSRQVVEVPDLGPVEDWVEVVGVNGDLVTFDSPTVLPSGEHIESRCTLRFRGREEIETSLLATGWSVIDVRDAPDRPGQEFVFIARRG